MTTGELYVKLFLRLLEATAELPPSKAAVVGMHWERWQVKNLVRNTSSHNAKASK